MGKIVITGAAGFIGSCLTSYLNGKGYTELILVDDFSRKDKKANLEGKKFLSKVERETFFTWLGKEKPSIDFVFHLGARTDTTEFNYAVHQHLNLIGACNMTIDKVIDIAVYSFFVYVFIYLFGLCQDLYQLL